MTAGVTLYGPAGTDTDITSLLKDLAAIVKSIQQGYFVGPGAVSDANVAAGAAIAQSKIAGLVAKFAALPVNLRDYMAGEIATGAEDGPGAQDGAGRIVKVKRFAIEPMFEEDAVTRMEELGHAFFVFVNAENERVSILYRRSEGDYGLIEPVVGGDYTKGGPIRRSGAR